MITIVGIYKITNLINGKIYVGQSIDIADRWKQHIYKAFNCNEKAYTSAIHNAFRKYGVENFKLEIIEECLAEELDSKEKFWIKELNSLYPNGYNILPGGQKGKRRIYPCSKCGTPISKNNKTSLCLKCYKESIRKNIPTKIELFTILTKEKENFVKVSKIYNVTDNAVRRWCRSYNLPFHSSDYKQSKK